MNFKSTGMFICLLALLVASPIAAQDEKKGTEKEKNGEKELVKQIMGTWQASKNATKQYWMDIKLEESLQKQRILDDASKMSIAFLKGNKLRVVRRRPEKEDFRVEGTFSFVKGDVEEKTLTVKFTPADEAGPDEIEVEIKILKIDMKAGLAITPSNDPPVVFVMGGAAPSKKAEPKKAKKDANK